MNPGQNRKGKNKKKPAGHQALGHQDAAGRHDPKPGGHQTSGRRHHHQPAARPLDQPAGSQPAGHPRKQPARRGRDRFAGQVDESVKREWTRQQLELKKDQVAEDSVRVRAMVEAVKSKNRQKTFYIGGVDISFIKENKVDACAALVILSYPSLQVVYSRLEMIQLTAPYIPGFLAFREVESLKMLYGTMEKNAPQFKPDIMIVDGNGMFHPRRFGLACHLGVELDIPCIGVAKTLMHVDGIRMDAAHNEKINQLERAGDTFPLTTRRGETLGLALRNTDHARTPVYVSQGHRVSLESALVVVRVCSKFRIPEPTRQADLLSRQYLARKKHEPEEMISRVPESDTLRVTAGGPSRHSRSVWSNRRTVRLLPPSPSTPLMPSTDDVH